ncbi:MAG: response regulator transcription factor [Anaerolineaceae bacterium]|nr:response regulator transcription factor [Anaerolineaceae bacterium]
MIRVLLCDDQIVVTEGLRKILSTDPEIEVLGAAQNGAELLEMVPKLHPALVLIDLKMSVMNGVLATRKIRKNFPNIHVLVLTTYDDDEWVFDALRAGAEGYLLKDLPPDQLIDAIKGTVKGKSYIDPKVTGKVIKKAASLPRMAKDKNDYDLTERQMEVLKLIAQGFSNADIAERLFLSEGTVSNYTRGIFNKMGVSARTQAAVAAIKYGLIDISEI